MLLHQKRRHLLKKRRKRNKLKRSQRKLLTRRKMTKMLKRKRIKSKTEFRPTMVVFIYTFHLTGNLMMVLVSLHPRNLKPWKRRLLMWRSGEMRN